jgi:hypothetical protein
MFTLIRLLFLPVRFALGTAKLGVKTGYRTGRLVGYNRLAVLGVGVGIGILVAPGSGADTRAKLRRWLDDHGHADGDSLAERVQFELSHSPRTWHLPQPDVEVVGRAAVLRGTVPHETGRADLERAAAGVPGVATVDNQLRIAPGTNGHGGDVPVT